MKVCATCGNEFPDEQKFCPNDGSPLRSTTAGNLIGSIIAERYHISKKLGEGGMGAVYLGEHVKMGRKSAIKVMSQSMAHDHDAIARFNREAANAARINHPNVCAIYDFGETPDGTIYLAMEFIEGETLTDLIHREGQLPPQRAADILRQTGDALEAAHDLGIVHRDLKPDNIMIAKGRGGTDVVKVVDFGIAKAMGGEEGQNVTKTGLVVGTPEYMSPEQLSGDVLDGRSDIYSVALVFYRMLTGLLPFQADSAQETMIKRLTDDPLPLNQARPDMTFPAALQQVMNKALQRMPRDRYESAAAFAEDALRAVEEMPSTPAPDTEAATQLMDAAAVTAQIPQTRLTGQPAAPTEPVDTIATPTPTTPQPAPSPVAPPKKKLPMTAIAAVAVILAGVGVGTVVMTGGNGDKGTELDSAAVAAGTPGVMGNTARQAAGNAASRTDSGSPATTAGEPTPGGERSDGQTEDTAAAQSADTAVTSPRDEIVTPPATGIQVNPDEAYTQLDDMLFRLDRSNAAGIRDTALAYYESQAVAPIDRAFAAYVIADSFGTVDNINKAIAWADSAIRLDSTASEYQQSRVKWVAQLPGANE